MNAIKEEKCQGYSVMDNLTNPCLCDHDYDIIVKRVETMPVEKAINLMLRPIFSCHDTIKISAACCFLPSLLKCLPDNQSKRLVHSSVTGNLNSVSAYLDSLEKTIKKKTDVGEVV